MRRFTPTRESRIPEGACKVRHKDGLAEVYTYRTVIGGKLAAIAFIGKQSKPVWHFTFKDEDRRAEKIADLFASVEKSRASKQQRRSEASAPHTVKVGAIIYNSWGYDQTNVDWYAVVAVSKNFVTLRAIAKHYTEDGFMSGESKPAIDTTNPDPATWGVTFTSEQTERHRVYAGFDGKSSINFEHGSGSVWDGKRVYESHYA